VRVTSIALTLPAEKATSGPGRSIINGEKMREGCMKESVVREDTQGVDRQGQPERGHKKGGNKLKIRTALWQKRKKREKRKKKRNKAGQKIESSYPIQKDSLNTTRGSQLEI